jgi:2-polyprenyl-3-methyl-5-hydroxy-6-metoxy-1,4-benzoquinol methylase
MGKLRRYCRGFSHQRQKRYNTSLTLIRPIEVLLTNTACPLCFNSNNLENLHASDKRRYFACPVCSLAFVHPDDYLTADEERTFYDTHENSIEDEGYVQFLNILVEPLLALIPTQGRENLQALDYGCGPGPTLSILLENTGIACDNYDPFFANNALREQYDIITATECFEHFHHPAEELKKLCNLLAPNGYLALMTSRWENSEKFANWHYTRDPTHVIFMHDKTIEFIEKKYHLNSIFKEKNRVVIFRKN